MRTKHILTLTIVFLYALTSQAQFMRMGKTWEKSMESHVLGKTKGYCIYLPPSYSTDTTKQYPVLYLLHGYTDNYTAWRDKGQINDIANQLIAAGDACEMIIVMPDAGTDQDGYYNMEGWNYEDYFFKELIPYIEKEYRAIGDKQHRAVAGLSMGGGGAVGYAQHHPEMFSSAYGISPWLGVDDPAEGRRTPGDARMEKLMKANYENNCNNFLKKVDDETKKELRTVRWFIDIGDDDFLFDLSSEFISLMRKSGIPYQLRVRDGSHTWVYFQQGVTLALPFVSRSFGE